MISKFLMLVALAPAALSAPTAAQKAQARKDWADISVRSNVQAKYLCKLYLPRITVTKGAPVTQTVTAGTLYATETASTVTETITTGTVAETTGVETQTVTSITETETTTSTEYETVFIATVTTTDASCPTPVRKRSLEDSALEQRAEPALSRRAKGESAETVFNRIKANDPEYLTSVCSQLQTSRWTSAVRPTTTRSILASGTVTETPTATTTVPAATETVTEFDTRTETVTVPETVAVTTTSTVSATSTTCAPPAPTCSRGFTCGGAQPQRIKIGNNVYANCYTGANGQPVCALGGECTFSCSAGDNSCPNGQVCVINSCCQGAVCLRACPA